MAVNKYITSAICLLMLIYVCNAQIYNLKSLSGDKVSVKLIPDYPNNILTIARLNDTIHIADFLDLKAVTVLNKCFWEMLYSVRGGSDETVLYISLISVKNNKLYQSAHFPAFLKYDISKVYNKLADSLKLFSEHGLYRLDVDIVNDKKASYKMIVNIQDVVESKHDHKAAHNIREQVNLTFDSHQCLFFSAHEYISRYFTVYDPKIQRTVRRHLAGTFPVIQLGRYKSTISKKRGTEKDKATA